MNRKTTLLLAASAVAASGCATMAVFSGLSKTSLSSFIFLRSLTVQPPGGAQQVTTFMFPLTNAKSVQREQFGAECAASPSACITTFSSSDFKSNMLTDASASANVPYEYTVTLSDNSTQSRFVRPIDVQNQAVTLTSPGTGAIDIVTGAGTPSLTSNPPTLTWQALQNKDPSLNYGFYVVVGKEASSSFGIDPVYSAFLDESSHSTSVAYGTPSDLLGFTQELTTFLAGNSQTAMFAAKAASGPLPPGQYAWTVVTVDTNASESLIPGNVNAPTIPPQTSFGIAKPASPFDPEHFLYFQVK